MITHAKHSHNIFSAQTNIPQEKTEVIVTISHARSRQSPLSFLSLGTTLMDGLVLLNSISHGSKRALESLCKGFHSRLITAIISVQLCLWCRTYFSVTCLNTVHVLTRIKRIDSGLRVFRCHHDHGHLTLLLSNYFVDGSIISWAMEDADNWTPQLSLSGVYPASLEVFLWLSLYFKRC